MTHFSIETEVCVPVIVTGIYDDEREQMQIDTLITPGFGDSFSKRLFERLPRREEDCIIDELIAEREKVLAEMKNERGIE
jgi:hypothetical protein